MLKIHGLPISSNTTKTIFVAEEVGADYEFIVIDMAKGEHKSPEHMKRHPLGKVPTLTTKSGETLFESGAICRYIALSKNSSTYPTDNILRKSKIDQWMDFFTIHLGRWLNSYAFEKVAKEKYGFGTPNMEVAKEALGFIEQQMPAIEGQLSQGKFLVGGDLSIADLFAFAYMENTEMGQIPLENYPNTKAWYENLKQRDSVKRAFKKLGRP